MTKGEENQQRISQGNTHLTTFLGSHSTHGRYESWELAWRVRFLACNVRNSPNTPYTEVYWTVLAVQSMATLAAPATFCVASFA